MSLKINTNIASLNVHKNMVKTDNNLSSSLQRLSSGLRINKSADDASGMFIADSLRSQAFGLGQASRNANDAINIVQTADGALEESINIINIIKTKTIQAAQDGQTLKSRKAIQSDIDRLREEYDKIARDTSFNGQKLLSGGFTNKKFQIGAYSNETVPISINSTESNKIGHTTVSSVFPDKVGRLRMKAVNAQGTEIITQEVNIQYNNNPENGLGYLADEINKISDTTGIKAVAVVTSESKILAGKTGNNFSINGVLIGNVPVKANDSPKNSD